jgi:protein phosphatase
VFEADNVRRPLRLPSLLLHPLKATQPDDSHFEPESDEYLNALIIEDRRRARRRRISWIAFIVLVIGALVAAGIIGYGYTQRHYYVGSDEGRVAIFRGVQQDIGPIQLSHVYETTTITLDELPQYSRASVEATINASSLADAQRIVDRLSNVRSP